MRFFVSALITGVVLAIVYGIGYARGRLHAQREYRESARRNQIGMPNNDD